MKHIIAVLLENEPGAVARLRPPVVTTLRASRLRQPGSELVPRMTIQTSGSDDVIEQITKHLNRLIEVVMK
jgi:acetolactate synthase-1/3 small subunit